MVDVVAPGALVLILLPDAVTFQDLFEPHPVRDWLVLAASALAIAGLVGRSARVRRLGGRRG